MCFLLSVYLFEDLCPLTMVRTGLEEKSYKQRSKTTATLQELKLFHLYNLPDSKRGKKTYLLDFYFTFTQFFFPTHFWYP